MKKKSRWLLCLEFCLLLTFYSKFSLVLFTNYTGKFMHILFLVPYLMSISLYPFLPPSLSFPVPFPPFLSHPPSCMLMAPNLKVLDQLFTQLVSAFKILRRWGFQQIQWAIVLTCKTQKQNSFSIFQKLFFAWALINRHIDYITVLLEK